MNFKEKNKIELKQVCSTCNKPISDKAQSNVTRFLFTESRCVCPRQTADSSVVDKIEQKLPKLSTASVEENLGDRYEVQDLLGRGGMGAVYKVKDKQLDKTFAIKVLNADLVEDKSSLKRFEQEAQAARSLTSPNLVAVYDFGMGKKGSPYIVMDYLDGLSLDVVLKQEGFINVPRALDIFVQMGEAISHAHAKSVIHRDIKPSNIILTQGDNNLDFVKLVDFGIAKVLPSEQKVSENLTQTGDIFGSPLYMSPEQCLGNKLDARSDIYAFGCVMYECLTGHPPFTAENPIKIILKHIDEDPAPIPVLSQDYNVPKPLNQLIIRCLAKEPKDRYQSAVEIVRDLEAIRDGKAIRIKYQQTGKKARTPWKRKRPPLILSVLVAIVTLLLTSMYFFTAPHTTIDPAVLNPASDARNFDNISYQYFLNKDYEKAIPLLEFGISAYKGTDPYYLADNYQHIGKCYKELGKYAQAVDFYEKALKIYADQANGYLMVVEARRDYADVLRHLGQTAKAALVDSGKYEPTSVVEPAPNMR